MESFIKRQVNHVTHTLIRIAWYYVSIHDFDYILHCIFFSYYERSSVSFLLKKMEQSLTNPYLHIILFSYWSKQSWLSLMSCNRNEQFHGFRFPIFHGNILLGLTIWYFDLIYGTSFLPLLCIRTSKAFWLCSSLIIICIRTKQKYNI